MVALQMFPEVVSAPPPSLASLRRVTTERPLAVLMSGAPGSGKTTLAAVLGAELDLPVLDKDRLVHGVWRTRGWGSELGLEGVELFYATMELWLEAAISFVGDMTFVRCVSEPDVAARVMSRGQVVNVHCRSSDALARFERRTRAAPLCGPNRLDRLLALAARYEQELYEPLDFGCPTIVVDTTDGYSPQVLDIVAKIDGHYDRPAFHELDRPAVPGGANGGSRRP
jgi:hypothetical protein